MSVPTSGEHARSGARAARLLSPVALSLSLAACAHSGSVGTTADREVLHHPLPHEFGDNANVTLVEVYYPPGGSSRSHRHPCPVVAYVVDGAIRMQVQGGV